MGSDSDKGPEYTYWKAVERVYKATGESSFFGNFVREYRNREMKLWKLRREDDQKLEDERYRKHEWDRPWMQRLQNVDLDLLDADGDAMISEEEFLTYMIGTHKSDLSRDQLAKCFQEIDADGGGIIDKSELAEFEKKLAAGEFAKKSDGPWSVSYEKSRNRYIFQRKQLGPSPRA